MASIEHKPKATIHHKIGICGTLRPTGKLKSLQFWCELIRPRWEGQGQTDEAPISFTTTCLLMRHGGRTGIHVRNRMPSNIKQAAKQALGPDIGEGLEKFW